MAAHRAMQAANIPVTASAPMSGPYALAAQSDATFYGNVNAGGTIFSPMIFTSFQKAYGDLYITPADIYESAYATGIETLLPGDYDFTTVVTSGKLPQLRLFNLTPPTAPDGSPVELQPTLNAITPPTGTGDKYALFAMGFGTGNLIKNSARLSYLLDAMVNPDGVVPAFTSGLAAATPQNKIRWAAKANDLRDWTPQAPVLLCAGNGDPTVFYDLNTDVMKRLWAGLPAGLITVLDVDSDPIGDSDPFAPAKVGFAAAKNALITASGANAAAEVTGAYHGTLVPPYCNAAARAFFSKF
jgi:hypothetical protein